MGHDQDKKRFRTIGDIHRDANQLPQQVRQSSESISQDQDGIYTATFVSVSDYYNSIRACRSQKTHPQFQDLLRTNFGIQRMDGDLGRATTTFKGVFQNDEYIRYNIKVQTRTEPIETHPFFDEGRDIPKGRTDIKKDRDAYGYRFGDEIDSGDPDGSKQAYYELAGGQKIFKHFPMNADFDLQGIKSYLAFGMTMEVVIVTYIQDGADHVIKSDIEKGGYAFLVGQVVDPPKKIKPSVDRELKEYGGVGKNYNWLVTGCDIDIVGSALRQKVTFLLSGYLGWNGLLYNKQDKSANINNDFFKKLNK